MRQKFPFVGMVCAVCLTSLVAHAPSFEHEEHTLTQTFTNLRDETRYKELCLEDPLTFSAIENMASSAPLNTWLCPVCASWNHPSRNDCSRCASKRS